MPRRRVAQRGGGRRRGRRRVRRRTRRLIRGTAAILMVGGTASAYKLQERDIKEIEKKTKRSADDLTEQELKDAMKKLGITQLELTEEDEIALDKADKGDD